jgi:hypothetical protein
MPLEDLEAYGKDSGSSGHASNSVDEPKTPQYDTDTNATEAESNDGRSGDSEEQTFDGRSDSNSRKVIHCFADFIRPYFYFVLNLL